MTEADVLLIEFLLFSLNSFSQITNSLLRVVKMDDKKGGEWIVWSDKGVKLYEIHEIHYAKEKLIGHLTSER